MPTDSEELIRLEPANNFKQSWDTTWSVLLAIARLSLMRPYITIVTTLQTCLKSQCPGGHQSTLIGFKAQSPNHVAQASLSDLTPNRSRHRSQPARHPSYTDVWWAHIVNGHCEHCHDGSHCFTPFTGFRVSTGVKQLFIYAGSGPWSPAVTWLLCRPRPQCLPDTSCKQACRSLFGLQV